MKKCKFKYLSNNRKNHVSFSIILFLLSLTLFLCFNYQIESYQNQKQHYSKLYGKWSYAIYDVNDDSVKSIQNNALIEKIGFMKIYGEGYSNHQSIGIVGSSDSSFFDLAQLSLKKGHYPAKENEIMVETFVLDLLNLDYEINQEISLSIENNETTYNNKYVICGIIENYSSNWNNDGKLANMFIYGNNNLDVQYENIFMQSIAGYEGVFHEISLSDYDRFVENDIIELSYHPFSKYNLSITLFSLFSICYVLIVGWLILLQWTNKKNQEINIFKSLGVDDEMLMHDLVRLLVKSSKLSFLLILILMIISKDIIIPLIILIIIVFVELLFIMFFYIQIKNIDGIIRTYHQKKRYHKRRIISIKKLTPLRIALRFIRLNIIKYFIQLTSISLLLISTYFSIQTTIKSKNIIEKYNQYPDIEIQTNTSFQSIDAKIIDSVVLNKLENLSGAQKVISYYDYDKYFLEWDLQNNSVIYQSSLGNKLFYNDSHLSTNLMLTDINDSFIDIVQKYIKENIEINRNIDENKVILYLPTIYAIDSNDMIGYTLDENEYINPTEILNENTIHVGDMINIFRKDGKLIKKVEVGAIIYEKIPYFYGLDIQPYSIIGSYNLLFNLKSPTKIKIFFDESEDRETMENLVYKIVNNNYKIENMSYFKREQLAVQETQLMNNVIIFIIFLLVILFTQTIYSKNEQQSQHRIFNIFEQLGIDSKQVTKIVIYINLIIYIFAIVISFAIFSFIQFYVYSQSFSEYMSFRIIFDKTNWSWTAFLVINIFLFIHYIGLSMLNLKIFRRNKI